MKYFIIFSMIIFCFFVIIFRGDKDKDIVIVNYAENTIAFERNDTIFIFEAKSGDRFISKKENDTIESFFGSGPLNKIREKNK